VADIGAIIEIWLKNNGWTHKMLAERLIVSESTVQKWIKGKRHPDPEMLKRLSEILLIDIKHFYEPNYLPVRFERIDDFVPPCMYGDLFLEILKQLGENMPEELIKNPLPRQDTCHEVYDAGLYNEAKLHRFVNRAGDELSAIYLRGEEVWWHYREYENQMIHDWNKQEEENRA